jgi:hypothetical protein
MNHEVVTDISITFLQNQTTTYFLPSLHHKASKILASSWGSDLPLSHPEGPMPHASHIQPMLASHTLCIPLYGTLFSLMMMSIIKYGELRSTIALESWKVMTASDDDFMGTRKESTKNPLINIGRTNSVLHISSLLVRYTVQSAAKCA